MAAGYNPIDTLLQALKHNPENVQLRISIGAIYLSQGRLVEAESFYRESLSMAPRNVNLEEGLAETFFRAGKDSETFVLLESLVNQQRITPHGRVLFTRLLIKQGSIADAIAQYRAAIDDDVELRNIDLEQKLGIDAKPGSYEEVSEGKVRAGWNEASQPNQFELSLPEIDFASVGGMQQVKQDINLKIIAPLKFPEIYQAYGKKAGGGILLYGPPGCGKTLLARATAGELKARFLNVGINDILDMWIGNSEKNLHGLFQTARDNKPVVLFFDEMDALGAKRSDMKHSAGRHLVNQFLSEMDGVQSDNQEVLVLAATNAPWHIDSAFRRPGRFDKILFVPPPDLAARQDILKILCTGKPQEIIDFSVIAKKTEGFSGADLKAVVDLAIEDKLLQAMQTGKILPLTEKDLLKSAKDHKPTIKEWFATARNYAKFANEDGLYDDVLKYLK